MIESSNTLRSGYLSKRSVNATFCRWNRRFFVLDDRRTLSYYISDNNSLILRAIIVITKQTKISTGHKRFGEQCLAVKMLKI